MAQWKYRKPEASHIQGVCVVCNERPQRPKPGGEKFRAICRHCERKEFDPNHNKRVAKYKDSIKRPYRKYVKNTCESCGFTSEFKCQFDVDHIDGNHSNNNQENLQTLCANCHRLKTFLNKDWEQK